MWMISPSNPSLFAVNSTIALIASDKCVKVVVLNGNLKFLKASIMKKNQTCSHLHELRD